MLKIDTAGTFYIFSPCDSKFVVLLKCKCLSFILFKLCLPCLPHFDLFSEEIIYEDTDFIVVIDCMNF